MQELSVAWRALLRQPSRGSIPKCSAVVACWPKKFFYNCNCLPGGFSDVRASFVTALLRNDYILATARNSGDFSCSFAQEFFHRLPSYLLTSAPTTTRMRHLRLAERFRLAAIIAGSG